MPPNDRHRYERANRTLGALVLLLVGLGLTLGGAALTVGLVRDVRAFPDAPVPMHFSDAVALADPARGTWVSIEDASVDCSHPPAVASSRIAWAVVAHPGAPGRILVDLGSVDAPACDQLAPPFVGVLSTRPAGDLPRLPRWELEGQGAYVTVLHMQRSAPSVGDFFVIPVLVLPGVGMLWGLLLMGKEGWARPAVAAADPLSHVGLAMPLSTGASALHLFTTPMIAFHLIAFGPLFFATRLPEWTVVPVGILWAAWFFTAVGLLLKGWNQRASDLLLGHEGLEIRGGPLGGTRLDWADLPDPAAHWEKLAEGDFESTLWIGGEVVATSDHPSEHRSLEAVACTVRHLSDQARGLHSPEQIDRPPHVLVCASCGCPISPVAGASTRCARCDAEATMPDGLRAQVRASDGFASARAQSEELLRRLVRQPGPGATNALMLGAIGPLLIGFPLASILFDEFYQLRGVLHWSDGVALVVGALAFSYGLVGLLRSQVVGRQALRVVASTFAARPPEREGEAWFCRQCGAPLPERPGEVVVVGCVHCEAECVVGIDMLPSAAREQGQALDLRSELTARLATRRRYRLVSLASLLLIAGSATVLWPVLGKMAG